MLTAARRLGPPAGQDRYPPLEPVLARVLASRGLYRVVATRARLRAHK